MRGGRGDFQERRRQADWVVNAASILSVISWLVAFAVVLVLDIAAPERANFFTNVFDGVVTPTWNQTFLPFALILLILSFCSCIAAFIFNMMRMRRKTDKYRKSVIIMGVLTLIGIIAFIFRFGSYLI